MLWTPGSVVKVPLAESQTSTLTEPRESIWSVAPPQLPEANVRTEICALLPGGWPAGTLNRPPNLYVVAGAAATH